MAGKRKKMMLKSLNVKIVKLLDKLEVQTNLQERVKDLEEIIDKFEEKLIVNDKKDKEDSVEDKSVKSYIDKDTNSKKHIVKVSNEKEYMVKRTNDTENIPKKNVKLDETKCLSIQKKLLNCKLCDRVFDKHSDLENHIIKIHEKYQKFECGKCRKIFVTEWRLNKHGQIHDGKTKKHCHYFKTGKSCPFEELGCKFLHLFSDTEVKRPSWKQVISTLEESWESFYTSTPRKPFEDCEECLKTSKCTDCIVKHMLGQHACAKLMFS